MRTLPLKEFILLFPSRQLPTVKEVYENAFLPSQILYCFEGWEYLDEYGCYIDNSEECNMIWFGTQHYYINGLEFRWPTTLNEFIEDCRASQITLRWSEPVADKLWLSH